MQRIRVRLVLEGIVQGVGFRPFASALAERLGLSGFVANDSSGACVEVEGPADALDAFRAALRAEAPPLAEIRSIRSQSLPTVGSEGFAIRASERQAEQRAAVAPDAGTCAACLAEVLDPDDRRHRHAFASCTHCGPRFTIVEDVPYDRARTTMADFPLCPACRREFDDPRDRRHHAQPICCPDCGPQLALLDAAGHALPGDPIARTAAQLRAGAVVAVKGLGGYHLAVRAADEKAVTRLRERKRRFERPFAVMAPDLAWARRLVELGPAEARALESVRRPILLADRRPEAPVAPSVAPGCDTLGVLLPYTPLHHLLAHELGEPFVLTSGNVSDEPIAYEDDDARARLAGLADSFLLHGRRIRVRCDDSIVRVARGRERILRRSRGWVPAPLSLPWRVRRPILACGAELKSTFGLAKDDRAFLSHHLGDLESYETWRAYCDGVAHFQRLFDVAPELVAHDLHAEYLSTKYAQGLDGVETVAVQHHHAHAAACLAEHGEAGPALAVCFDGLGLGDDGTLWGGEFLAVDLATSRRLGRLRPVPLPGGASAIRDPWRMAVAHLVRLQGDDPPRGGDLPPAADELLRRHADDWRAVWRLATGGPASPPTSSAGRLFDAAAALLGVRDRTIYEAQAAIELERLADPSEESAYPVEIEAGELVEPCGTSLLRALLADCDAGVARERAAARFHNGLADAALETCRLLRERTGLGTVVLSGGVFQNRRLEARLVRDLERSGFRVLTHERVPPNDGGIAFGQLVVAAARDRVPHHASTLRATAPLAAASGS